MRAPTAGVGAIGLTMISPLSRKRSAIATTQMSLSFASVISCNRLLIFFFAHVEVAGAERIPSRRIFGRRRVFFLEGLIAAIVRRAFGEMRPAFRLDHGLDHHAINDDRLKRRVLEEILGRDDLLGADERTIGRHAEEIIKIGIGPERLRVPRLIGAVHMDERDVEAKRRHRDELLTVFVGRAHKLQLGLMLEHGATEPGARRKKGEVPGRGAKAELEHALVELKDLEILLLSRDAEMRLERDGVEADEAVDRFLQLPRAVKDADLGAAIADDSEILHTRTDDRSDERHRFTTRAPAADADGHPILQRAHDLIESLSFINHF